MWFSVVGMMSKRFNCQIAEQKGNIVEGMYEQLRYRISSRKWTEMKTVCVIAYEGCPLKNKLVCRPVPTLKSYFTNARAANIDKLFKLCSGCAWRLLNK